MTDATEEQKIGLEEAMARLEAIVSELEKGEQTLEGALARFEEGLALGKRCREILDRAETRVRELLGAAEDGSLRTKDWQDER
jgi:exodeoxyribonuclease VII small subunit